VTRTFQLHLITCGNVLRGVSEAVRLLLVTLEMKDEWGNWTLRICYLFWGEEARQMMLDIRKWILWI